MDGIDPQSTSDQALVELTLQTPQAYRWLVERYSPRLLRYVRRLGCRTEHDAKDVLQEVFIKAYVHLRSYDADLAFSSWIYRICHNETMSWFRKQRVRPQAAGSEEELFALESLADPRDFVEGIEQNVDRARLTKAMEGLREDYRDVLVLRFFEEKSYQEIGDILQKPPGTVATLLNRAKAQLATLLASHV